MQSGGASRRGEQCAASARRRRSAMRLLLPILALAAASVPRALPDNTNKPAAPDYKLTKSIYNSIFPQNNQNKPSVLQTKYSSPSLLSRTPPFPVLMDSEDKRITPENKSVNPSINNSVSKTPNVKVKSTRELVHNSVITNQKLHTTPNMNASKPSLTETDDVLVSLLGTVNGVLGESLSLWNYSGAFGDGKPFDHVFQLLEDGLALLEGARNASVRFSLWPGVAVEMEPRINGSVSVGIKSEKASADARGMNLRKRFIRIFPYILVPPLIMSAILPFVLPAMKLMAVAAGALNQMALVGAVLTIMRNHAFSDTPKKKVIYINAGYKNEQYHRDVDNHHVEHSHDSDSVIHEDLKKYEEPYHGYYPQSSYGKGTGGFKDPEHLEFAASDDKVFQGGAESGYEEHD